MRKYTKIYAPVNGVTIDITEVSDPVFAEKLVGDGVAIKPTSNIISSPCNGVVNHLFPTNHAFTIITEEGTEILLHLGIDTVDLKGEGFKRVIKEDNLKVKIGDPIIEMDLDFILRQGKQTEVMIIISDNAPQYKFKKNLNKEVSISDEIFKFKRIK